MMISDLLIGIDKHTGPKAYEQLQNSLRQMDGVVNVQFKKIKPHCQGLLVRYNPVKTKTASILHSLNDFDDQAQWKICYPGEHCKTCELHLI